MAEIFSCCQAAVLAILDEAPDRTSKHKKPRKSQFGFKGVSKFLSNRTAVLSGRFTQEEIATVRRRAPLEIWHGFSKSFSVPK
jgi:hypothetical protein